LTVMLK